MSEETEIDLYGDLLDDALTHPLENQIERLKDEERLKQEECRNFNEKLGSIKEECEFLKESNNKVQKNMQILLDTARAEVSRFDKLRLTLKELSLIVLYVLEKEKLLQICAVSWTT